MPRRGPRRSTCLLLVLLAACGPAPDAEREAERSTDMNAIARDYVRLVLAVGVHDADYVDAYYGPPEWRTEVESAALPLPEILRRATELRASLTGPPAGAEEMTRLRERYLRTQLGSLIARVELLGGKRLSFDEESRALYDAVAPRLGEEHFRQVLDRLEQLLPGPGTLEQRYTEFRKSFIIPAERLSPVFDRALAACRERTAAHLELPAGESFVIEYVTDKPWSGYNWYKGGFHSQIQVNTDLPIYIDRAIDLACHEGYPGHHVYNLLLEKELVRDRGWVEFTVYPLFSPQSLIAEGTANHGIRIAFPGDERVAFEKQELFPLAGLDPASAERFYRVQELADSLDYAGNAAARRYLDGEIDAAQAAEYLQTYGLMAPERAEQRVRFIDRYRSYVINYNLGQDLVREYIESRSGGDPARAWEVFSALLSSPRLPSDLAAAN